MFTLKLLGGVELTGPNGRVGGRVTQRRRLAVLAVLGASRVALTRPKVLGLLWPDVPEARGRHLLSDTLYVIRKALGEDAVLTPGDEVRLNPDRVRVDVRTFREAAEAGRDEEAIELYCGPFLDGFYVSGAPSFDKWTDSERRKHAGLFREALERLAGDAEEAGRHLEALDWWKRRAGHEPLNSRVVVRLMQAYASTGDKAGALECARVHRRLLREEFGADPPEVLTDLEEQLRTSSAGAAALSARRREGPVPSTSTTEETVVAPRNPGRSGWDIRLALVLAAATFALLGGGVAVGWMADGVGVTGQSARGPPPSASTVTVLPFRTAGVDPSLAFLGEGMVDLLAAKLTGVGGPRAADARPVLDAWNRAHPPSGADRTELGLRIARRLEAGRLLTGSVVGDERRLVLTGVIRDVSTGEVRSRASVQGSFDRLMDMVDRFVAQILVKEAGEASRGLSDLTTRSLPALRSYLAGQAAYRSGRSDDAMTAYTRAVELDSTFALAALRAHLASTWIRRAPPFDALRTAWRHRDRLSERDRTLLTAEIGPGFPGPSSGTEMLAARRALVEEQPDNPEAWFALGDFLVHFGAYQDIPDSTAIRRAVLAFDRSLALDSTFLPALVHLFDISRVLGDTAASRSYGTTYLSREDAGLQASVVRSVLDLQSRGLGALPGVQARLDSTGGEARRRTLLAFYRGAPGSPESDSIVDALLRRMADPAIAPEVSRLLYGVAMDRGRPAEAASYLDVVSRTGRVDSLELAMSLVRDGLHYGGDLDAATRAAERIEARLGGPSAGVPGRRRAEALCVLGQWKLMRGESGSARIILDRLRSAAGDGESFEQVPAFGCVQLLDTWQAVRTGDPEARTLVARSDSLLRSGYIGPGRLQHEANLMLARCLERLGEVRDALRVLGRYPRYTTVPHYRPTFLRERGRIAALVGDTAAAVDAYRRYLAIRTNPEPGLAPQHDSVSEELERLAPKEPRAR